MLTLRALRKERDNLREYERRRGGELSESIENQYETEILWAEAKARPPARPTPVTAFGFHVLQMIEAVNQDIEMNEAMQEMTAQALLQAAKEYPDAASSFEKEAEGWRALKPMPRIPTGLNHDGFVVAFVKKALSLAGIEIEAKALSAQLTKAFPKKLTNENHEKTLVNFSIRIVPCSRHDE